MDVKTYEIQGQLVVVTTWDEKAQSFPISWIDLESTEAANHRMDRLQGTSQEKTEKAARVLASFGVRDAVSELRGQLDLEIRTLQGRVSRNVYEMVRGAFRSGFDGDRLFEVVAAEFSRRSDDRLVEEWARWLRQPETQHMVQMENAEPGDDDAIEKTRYLSALYADRNARHRRELVARLDHAVRASETGIETVTILTDALQDTVHLVLENPPAEEEFDDIRTRVQVKARRATLDSLLFSYRNATDEEIQRYLSYWESPDGQRVAGITMSAITAGARFGSKMAVENIAAAMGRDVEP